MRLDKLISSQGLCDRKQVKMLAKKGKVTVNGIPVKDPGFSVNPDQDHIVVDGKELSYQEFVYLMLNKPQGVICATEDRTAQTVLDLVPPELLRPGLFPAGRLDKDTTGFVLLTDDGALAHRMLSPKNHIQKTYEAVLDHPLSREDILALAEGITLKDGTKCLPAIVEPLPESKEVCSANSNKGNSNNTGNSKIRIKICEGKYHQIKRMMAARSNAVLQLKRTAMGNVPLDPALPEGACRSLTPAEQDLLLTNPS